MKVDIRIATEEDAVDVSKVLRDIDRMGFESFGVDVETSLRLNIRASVFTSVGVVDGEIACMWGILPSTMLGMGGTLWMVTTEKADQATFRFARHSQRMVEMIQGSFPVLQGFVDCRNERSKKWLKWLGFTFGPPYEVKGLPVIPFSRSV